MKKFIWALLALGLGACAPVLADDCKHDDDCESNEICVAGVCIIDKDAESPTTADGSLPADEGSTPGEDARLDSTNSPDAAMDGGRTADVNNPDARPDDAALDGMTQPLDGPPHTPDMGAGGADGTIPPPIDAAVVPLDGPMMVDGLMPTPDLGADGAIPPPADAAIPPPDSSVPPPDADNCNPSCLAQCNPSPELCDGQDNDCDHVIDNGFHIGEACTVGQGVCSREGLTSCDGCDGIAGIPGDEVCDGADNDCDGINDNGLDCDCEPGSSQDCYTGSARTQAVGLCQGGTQFCDQNHHWAACLNQVLPSPELCDNFDNDCDGDVDNLPGIGEACTVGVGACQSEGLMECGGMNGQLHCSAVALTPAPELCDNLDNDCDGQTDNMFGLGEACTVGIGACQSEGIMECGGLAGQLRCSATALAPTTEVCDNLDNDCDGQTDEDDNGSPRLRVNCYNGPALSEGVGACHSGTKECVDGVLSECLGEITPSNEDCVNGADNNCDGVVDNGVGCICTPATLRACYDGPAGTSGVGTCQAGSSRCNANGTGYGACENQVLPVAEECDGIDNDCDGITDDGLVDRACYTGPPATRGVGTCFDGMSMCLGQDGWGICSAEMLPSPEYCDGVDNDCDGVTDNAPTDVGEVCFSAGQGQCAVEGLTVCENGQQVCGAIPRAPATERCNRLDDDCDGIVDNGLTCPTWSNPVGAAGAEFVGTVTEVTKAQYASCVTAGACVAPVSTHQAFECNWQLPDRLDHPINCVTWNQARSYCQWAGGDIPTEDEWEALAGGRALVQPWGNTPADCNKAHTSGCAPRSTVPVLTLFLGGVSPAGAYDLIGSLREWTRTLVVGDPVLKGGGFDDNLQGLNINILWRLVLPGGTVNRASYDLGIRCARPAANPNP